MLKELTPESPLSNGARVASDYAAQSGQGSRHLLSCADEIQSSNCVERANLALSPFVLRLGSGIPDCRFLVGKRRHRIQADCVGFAASCVDAGCIKWQCATANVKGQNDLRRRGDASCRSGTPIASNLSTRRNVPCETVRYVSPLSKGVKENEFVPFMAMDSRSRS